MKCDMEVGKAYGGVIFIKEIPNPGKSRRRYCLVQCVHCGQEVGRILSHVHNGVIESCGCKFKKTGPAPKFDLGYRFTTKQGYVVEIIEYNTYSDITVRFDIDGYTLKTDSQAVKYKSMRHPYHKSTYGVGFDGELSKDAPYYAEVRAKWVRMIRRVYIRVKGFESYEDATVVDEWHNFTNFYYWAMQETSGDLANLDLDKDLFSKGKKIYSPEFCVMIPARLNKILTNLNKTDGGWYDPFGNRWRSLVVDPETGIQTHIKYNSEEEARAGYLKHKADKLLKVAELFKESVSVKVYERLVELSHEIKSKQSITTGNSE